jgi:hypothetical protein
MAVAASPDGRVWVSWAVRGVRAQGRALTEFDGEEWTEIRPDTWPQHRQGPVIGQGKDNPEAAKMRVGPGGDLWVNSYVYEQMTTRVVLVWDGEEWTTLTSIELCDCLEFLRPFGLPDIVFDFDDAADGSIWAIVGTEDGPNGLYVITPEAVAAAE